MSVLELSFLLVILYFSIGVASICGVLLAYIVVAKIYKFTIEAPKENIIFAAIFWPYFLYLFVKNLIKTVKNKND